MEKSRTLRKAVNFALALDALEQSLGIRRELGNDEDILYLLVRIGPTLAGLGRYPEAINTIEEGIRLSKEHELSKALADCHSAFIVVYREAGQLDAGRRSFNDALSLYESLGRYIDIADASLEIALAEYEQGDLGKAQQLFEQSIQVYREFDRLPKLAKALKELGKLQKQLKLDVAQQSLTESAQLFDDIACPNEAEIVRAMITT